MRIASLLLVFAAVLVPLSGHTAQSDDNNSGANAERTPHVIRDSIEKTQRKRAEEAMQSLRGLSSDQMKKAAAKAKQVVDAMAKRIAAHQAQVADAVALDRISPAERKKHNEMLDQIQERRITLMEWYGGVEYGCAKNWDKIKKGFVNAYTDLNDYFGKAVLAYNRDIGL